MKAVNTVGIIGSGRMGSDIAALLEERGHALVMICENGAESEKHEARRERRLRRLVKSGVLDESGAAEKRAGFVISSDIAALDRCDLIIEAVPEDLDLKRELFARIEGVVPSHALMATNSSSLVPSRVFSGMTMSDRCLGLHFFYPARLKNILEVTRSRDTSPETVTAVTAWLGSLGRRYLLLDEDNAFVLNRAFLDLQALGFWLHVVRGMSVRAVDNAVRAGLFADGLFSFFDAVGLDVMLASIKNYTGPSPAELYRPMIGLLEAMTGAGNLGRKSGCGFYDYGADNPGSDCDQEVDRAAVDALRAAYVSGACAFVSRGVCSAEEMDYALMEYMGLDQGPCELAATLGREKVLAQLEYLRHMTGCDHFTAPELPA
jgi:3-hydroxyacyl-CoA dehydrogenase